MRLNLNREINKWEILKIYWNAFRHGWTDHRWGCMAGFWWYLKSILPYPFSNTSSGMFFFRALVESYDRQQRMKVITKIANCKNIDEHIKWMEKNKHA